jgi:dolichyl-phosphate beta-glucosyltransferase
MSVFLSVIVPAYNEEKRIGPSLDSITSYLKRQSYSWEVIVADDGSSDATIQVSEQKLKGLPHKILKTAANGGKGSAVKRGMLAAVGEYRLFTDADLSTPIEEVSRVLKELQSGYDAVIGSRALSDSNVLVHQNFIRESMGRIFNGCARLLAFRGIHDSQCGFKAFNAKAAIDLFTLQKLPGFSFDVEIVFLSQHRGYRLLEIPVTWRNSEQSRVRLLRDPLLMFWDLLKIRWIHRNDAKRQVLRR